MRVHIEEQSAKLYVHSHKYHYVLQRMRCVINGIVTTLTQQIVLRATWLCSVLVNKRKCSEFK